MLLGETYRSVTTEFWKEILFPCCFIRKWFGESSGMFEDLCEPVQIDVSEMNDGLDILSDDS